MGRIVLLVTSPRLPAGLLTAQAWDLVRAHPVLTAVESDLAGALREAGADVRTIEPRAESIVEVVADRGTVVWLAGPAGDEPLARELGLRLAREPGLAELELLYGSWDPPGARLLDAVTVMDRLADGDPWKRQQTHQTLARYLLEEAYEAFDAIQAHDLDALREELGDVLLQVVLHARMAEEADPPWTIDDVAGGLVAKLVRRNPHVFGTAEVTGIDEIMENWERIKREEKDRGSILDGIALAQPALALAAKIGERARRAGIARPAAAAGRPTSGVLDSVVDEASLGAILLAIVADAAAKGLDAEAALRRAALAEAETIRASEPDP